jgi:hypothetical protein
MVYFLALGTLVDELLMPIGAQLVAFGMILIGIAALRARVWGGWRLLAPFVVGLYLYLIPFVGLILMGMGMGMGKPPYTFAGLWGVTRILLGYAVFSSTNEEQRAEGKS